MMTKSKCCNAPMKEEGKPDFIGSDEVCTMYWSCTKCKEPCDPMTKTTEELIEECMKNN